MKPKAVGAVVTLGAAAILATTAAPAANAVPSDGALVRVNFDSISVSPGLGIHDTAGLLAFIASDQTKTITVDTSKRSVTSVTG